VPKNIFIFSAEKLDGSEANGKTGGGGNTAKNKYGAGRLPQRVTLISMGVTMFESF
jgi:hypothetical protein